MSKLLIILFCACYSCCCCKVAAASYAKGQLLLHLTFEEGAGAVCEDASGNGNNGEILHEMRAVTRVQGKIGQGLHFLGVRNTPESGAVSVPNFFQEELVDGMTLELWMKLDDDADWERGLMHLFCCSSGNYGPGFILYYNWRNIMFLSGAGADKGHWKVAAPVPDLRNQWVHVAATYDGKNKTARIFIDGMLRKQINGVEMVRPSGKAPSLCIGSGFNGLSYGFRGILDEVRLYNYPLSPLEIVVRAKLDY